MSVPRRGRGGGGTGSLSLLRTTGCRPGKPHYTLSTRIYAVKLYIVLFRICLTYRRWPSRYIYLGCAYYLRQSTESSAASRAGELQAVHFRPAMSYCPSCLRVPKPSAPVAWLHTCGARARVSYLHAASLPRHRAGACEVYQEAASLTSKASQSRSQQGCRCPLGTCPLSPVLAPDGSDSTFEPVDRSAAPRIPTNRLRLPCVVCVCVQRCFIGHAPCKTVLHFPDRLYR
jgi:hypothetical protein